MSLKGLIEVNLEVKVGAKKVSKKSIIRSQDLNQNVVKIEFMTRIEEEQILKEVDQEIVVVETTEEIERRIDTEIEIEEMIEVEMREEMIEAEIMVETKIESVKEIEEMMEEQTAGGMIEEIIGNRRLLRLVEKRKLRDSQDKTQLSEELCSLNGMMMKNSRNSKQMEITVTKLILPLINKDSHLNNEMLE